MTDTPANADGDIFTDWISLKRKRIGRHRRILLEEQDGQRSVILEKLREVARAHYVDPATAAERLKKHGAAKTAELLREMLPETKKARSGELGEILATEVAVHVMEFTVPIRRLRWKDGRNMALRGDDLVAFAVNDEGPVTYLKGESKSRLRLSPSVLKEADEKLLEDHGRPGRHSVIFVANRLYEFGDNKTAGMLEAHLLDSFRGCRVEHLLFALSGNPSATLLRDQLSGRPAPPCHAVGFVVDDHQEFIASVYEGEE